MDAQKYFEQHAEELIARFAGKNVALFFRGFVPANVRWLAQREDALLPTNKEEKNAAQEAFKNNSALVMICTKAFGMGELRQYQLREMLHKLYFLGHDEVVGKVLGLEDQN